MTLKHCLILLTIVAVMTDTMLLPFYPQFFSSAFDMHSSEHVGFYIAACCFTVMLAFPLWASLAKQVNELHLWVLTQIIAGCLGMYCYYTTSLVEFWIASLLMLAFKSSLLLIYPFVMRLEEKDNQLSIAGLFSVLVHFGGIGGALLGGIVLQGFNPKDMFLIMPASDAFQVMVCIYLIVKLKVSFKAKNSEEPVHSEPDTISGNKGFLVKLGLISLVFYFSAHLISPFFTVYWQAISAWNNALMSAIVYAIPAGIALVCLAWTHLRPSNYSNVKIINQALMIGFLGLLLQGTQEAWLVIFGRCLFGYALYQVTVRLDLILFNVSRPEDYASDYSKIHVYQNIGVIAASFAIGFITEHLSPSQPFFMAMAGFVLSAILFSWAFKSAADSKREVIETNSEPQTIN